MDRRHALTGGLCLLGSAWLNAALARAGSSGERTPLPRVPIRPDVSARTFELKLAPAWQRTASSRLRWLESMLHRLGRDATLAVWSAAFRRPDDGLMASTLSEGWTGYEEGGDGGIRLDDLVSGRFRSPVQGISNDQARELVLMDSGIRMPLATHPTLTVAKQATAYQALHLGLDGTARLAAAMADQLGKEGELLAYDFCREDRIARAGGDGSAQAAAEVLREWAELARPSTPSMFTAGLDVELIHETDSEVVVHVTACEWARYFRERHPAVGYLVACSTDDAALRAVTDRVWLQRTTTIMEGGEFCGFRIYAA